MKLAEKDQRGGARSRTGEAAGRAVAHPLHAALCPRGTD